MIATVNGCCKIRVVFFSVDIDPEFRPLAAAIGASIKAEGDLRGTDTERQLIFEDMTYAWQRQFSFDELKTKALEGHDIDHDNPEEKEKADMELQGKLRHCK